MSVSLLYKPVANSVSACWGRWVLMGEMRGEKWWGEGWRVRESRVDKTGKAG